MAKNSNQSNMHGRLIQDVSRLKHDTRVQEWYLSHNKMTKTELEQHLQNLPDSAGNVLQDADSSANGSGEHLN